MRKRLVDLGLTTIGAVALIGLIKALPLLAAFITLPTPWTAGQILTSGDLNAEFASILSQVNGNLDDTNIVAGAAIKGSKLADSPNGLTTTKLNDLSVTGSKLADLSVTAPKLAVGTAVHVQQSVAANTISVTAGSGAMTLLTVPAIVTRGGTVLLLSGTGGHVTLGGGSPSCIIRFKVLRDATPVSVLDYNMSGLVTDFATYLVAVPSSVDTPAAGSHSYSVTVESLSAGTCTFATSTLDPGGYSAVELS